MEYGFIDFAGGEWADIWVDTYNGLPEGDGRHRFFQACVDVGRAGYYQTSKHCESWRLA